jgi:peptide/nickel transport system permease protein
MTTTTAAAAPIVIRKKRNWLVDMCVRLVKEKPLGLFGAIIVLILCLTAIFAGWLAPYGYNEIILADRLSAPSSTHILGADNLGRDLLSRVIYGAQVSITIGMFGTLLATAFSAIFGIPSGFFGGIFDVICQRIVDAFLCFPPLVLYLTIMSVLGPGMFQVILVLGVTTGIRQVRVVRSAVISIRQNTYVEAAKAIGAPSAEIIWKHIMPNVLAPIIVLFTTTLGQMILAESTLSFLGFGIPPPIPSWGGMLSGTGRQYMLQAPWMVLWPGLALALVVYGVNMLGDAIRDIFDPRLRGGLGRYAGVKNKKPKNALV